MWLLSFADLNAAEKGYRFPSRVVHAHHIVMKVGKGVLGKRYTNVAQNLLRRHGIEVLDDAASLDRASAAGEAAWDNMTYALNFADEIHSIQYQRVVTTRLLKAKQVALKDTKNLSTAVQNAAIRQALVDELGTMKTLFTRGEAFWN